MSEHTKRSAAKAVTYRILVVGLDFIAIYWMTGSPKTSLIFMVASNVYTTVAYYAHERLWARVHWGAHAAGAEPPRHSAPI